jgi:hypothetical protein
VPQTRNVLRIKDDGNAYVGREVTDGVQVDMWDSSKALVL